MLNDLAAQDSDASLARRLRRYCRPQLLTVDEVGYLSYDTRYADLLFEVVTRRYHEKRPIILTTNNRLPNGRRCFLMLPVSSLWSTGSFTARRLWQLHGDSYRLHDAQQRSRRRAQERRSRHTGAKQTDGAAP